MKYGISSLEPAAIYIQPVRTAPESAQVEYFPDYLSKYGRNPGAGPSNEREWKLTAGFATGICHRNLPQEFATGI